MTLFFFAYSVSCTDLMRGLFVNKNIFMIICVFAICQDSDYQLVVAFLFIPDIFLASRNSDIKCYSIFGNTEFCKILFRTFFILKKLLQGFVWDYTY